LGQFAVIKETPQRRQHVFNRIEIWAADVAEGRSWPIRRSTRQSDDDNWFAARHPSLPEQPGSLLEERHGGEIDDYNRNLPVA
jgi:hypothetical protein